MENLCHPGRSKPGGGLGDPTVVAEAEALQSSTGSSETAGSNFNITNLVNKGSGVDDEKPI